MVNKLEVYKCGHCGIVAQVLHAGGGTMICCGEPMKLFKENTVDAAKEKHVPVVESNGGSTKVSVGSVAHPMEDTHYIEWVEVITDGKACIKFLSPGDAPEAELCGGVDGGTVRAYCNLHGLWKA